MGEDPDPDPVRVGSRGTIGSLMFRELQSIRRTEHKSSRSPDAVSISCGRPLASLGGYRVGMRKHQPQDSNCRPLRSYDAPATPRPSNVEGRRSSSECGRGLEAASSRMKRQDESSASSEEFGRPMLQREGEEGEGEGEGEGPSKCSFVQVVDFGCNAGTPIASRLRRLSFSRLSHSLN